MQRTRNALLTTTITMLVALFGQAHASGAVITVGPPDAQGNCVGFDFCTIQGAIDAAMDGDTILVAAATYVEQIDFKGKAVNVVSQSGAGATVIDGNVVPPMPDVVVKFVTGEGNGSVLDGFTILNGFSGTGGGIRCVGTAPTIQNNVIVANDAGSGGGIYASAAAALILDNTISGNTAGDGAGIFLTADSAALVRDNGISGNSASFGGGIACRSNPIAGPFILDNAISMNVGNTDGGGLFTSDSIILVADNTISLNEAERYGGGIACELDPPRGSVFRNNGIHDNVGFHSGGGISMREGSNPKVRDNLLSGNYGHQAGGGMFVEDSSPVIEDNMLIANGIHIFLSNPGPIGGGIACIDDTNTGTPTDPIIRRNGLSGNLARLEGAGIYLANADATVRFNTISSNGIISPVFPIDYTDRGSGIFVVDSDATLLSNLIQNNRADSGGAGIYCAAASSGLTIVNNMIALNVVASGNGGGIFTSQSAAIITNNTVAENDCGVGTGGGIYSTGSVSPLITNTIAWDNVGVMQIDFPVGSTAPTVNHSDVGPNEIWPGSNNISVDPKFVAAAGDFHIRKTSPCKNTGDNAAPAIPAKDFDKQNRIINGTVDRGADEVSPYIIIIKKHPVVPPLPPQ